MRLAGPLHDGLRGALAPIARRQRIARTLRGASIGLGIGAVGVAGLGTPPWAGLLMGLLCGAVGLAWPARPRVSVRRLDDAAELGGALLCAWDHQGAETPMARAQRNQALAALERRRAEGQPDVKAAPMPGPAWALGATLWILPFVMTTPTPIDADGPIAPDAPEAEGNPVAALTGDAAPPPASPAEAESRALAGAEPEPERAPAADAAVDDASTAERGSDGASDGGSGEPRRLAAIGLAAGEQGSGGAAPRPSPLAPGAGAALTLPSAPGALDPGDGPAGRLVVGRTPPPPDAIADPARPYPGRYRRAIAAWFDRSRP